MKTLARSLLGASASLMLIACTRSVSAPSDTVDTLTGPWRSQVLFSSGAFAGITDLQFMYVFNQGGTMTESSNYDAAPPVPPAYGLWKSVGKGQFEAKYLFYTTRAPTQTETATSGGGWLPAGYGELVERITVSTDGKTFTSIIRYTAFDQNGKPADGGGKGTGRGSRIEF